MWHLKTKLGVFWIVPVASTDNKFLLGINEEELGFYTNLNQVAKDVRDQATGFLQWDVQAAIHAPEHIEEWVEGEPKSWLEH